MEKTSTRKNKAERIIQKLVIQPGHPENGILTRPGKGEIMDELRIMLTYGNAIQNGTKLPLTAHCLMPFNCIFE